MKLISRLALTTSVIAGTLLPGYSICSEIPHKTKNNTATISAKANKTRKRLRLAFITNNPSDFWTITRKGTEKAVGDLNNKVKVDFCITDNGTAAEQKQIIDDLIAKGTDGIVISPSDPANQVRMLNDAARQTLIFTQNSDAPTSKRTCYVGTDNHAAGVHAGQEVKKALPDGGKIMIFVGDLTAPSARERNQGLRDSLKGSNIIVVKTLEDEADRARAKSNVEDALVKYPDLVGLVGLWSYNGPAILQAVKDVEKVGIVKIICFDEEDGTLAGIQSGAITSTIVQQPYEFGYQSIMNMAKYLWGDKSVVPANKKITVPTRVINKSSVKEFRIKLKRLRGRI